MIHGWTTQSSTARVGRFPENFSQCAFTWMANPGSWIADVAISATDARPVIPRRYFSGQLNRSNRIGEIMPLTRLSCEGVKASRHSS
jgi:hypothetical protein